MENDKNYAVTAWVLMAGGLGYAIFNSIYWGAWSYNYFGILTSLLILVFSFLPALQLLRVYRGRFPSGPAMSTSLVLVILSISWAGATALLHLLECRLEPCSTWSGMKYYLQGYWPAGIIYAIALLIMLVNIIFHGKKSQKKPRPV